MIEVTVDKILPSPTGLVLGMAVHYGEGGPVRFVQTRIPWSAFGRDTRKEMLAAFNRVRDQILDTEPLF